MQLQSETPDQFAAIVTNANPAGLKVELPGVDMFGFIHVSTLTGGYYEWDNVRARFTDRKSKRSYGLGDKLQVIVSRVDVWRKQVDFVPAPVEDESPEKNDNRNDKRSDSPDSSRTRKKNDRSR